MYCAGVCVDDPSDAYCAMYRNLLDDQITGVMVSWDYDREPYASPVLLVKKELQQSEVQQLLRRSKVKLFGNKPNSP